MSDSIFCPFPFSHTNISTTGSYQICCLHQTPKDHVININEYPISFWNNSQYVNDVKNSFLQEKKHPGCSECWQNETKGAQSFRQRVLQEHSIFKIDKNTNKLTTLEIQLGNLCNLTCLMCDEESSSAILSENIRLGVNIYPQKKFSWNDKSFDHLYDILSSGLKMVSIRGGETLYNKKLLTLMQTLPEEICANIVLHITTNATIWNKEWETVIKKFKLVRFMFSIDATDKLYEYIRFPSTWKNVESNIKEISKLKNVKPMVHCVVQNLNIGKMLDLIIWCQQEKIYLECYSLVQPYYLTIYNLPTELKKQAIEHVNQCLVRDNLYKDLVQFFINCRQQLTNSLTNFDQNKWQDFLTYITPRDQIRGNSHKEFLIYES